MKQKDLWVSDWNFALSGGADSQTNGSIIPGVTLISDIHGVNRDEFDSEVKENSTPKHVRGTNMKCFQWMIIQLEHHHSVIVSILAISFIRKSLS